MGSNGSLIHISIKSYRMCGGLSRRSASWHRLIWPNTDLQYKDIITKKQLPSIPELDDPSFTKHMDSRIFPVGMQRCQFPRKSTFYFYQSWLHLQNYSLPELMFAFSDNRSMQLKFTVLETLSFPERFHALRKGPFVAPGSP